MHRHQLFGTALGAALLTLPIMTQPASAQPAGGPMHRPSPAHETMADHRSPLAAPGAAERDAQTADRMAANQSPVGWLKEAEDALRRGHLAEANELLERAETRVLSRVTPAPLAGQPMQGPMLQHSAAARAALAARDRDGAMTQIRLAVAATRDTSASATGTDAPPMPAQAGRRHGMKMGPGLSQDGRATPPGSLTARDHGMVGSSMTRADHLSPPALPPKNVLRVQSGQAPAGSMLESQTAPPGQRLPVPASPNVAPPGRSTMPAAPRAGADAPMQGRTGGSNPTTMPNAAGNGNGMTGAPPAGGGAN
jgi:hypothetical protein